MRYKMRSEGMRESDFVIGTRFILKMLNENGLHPFRWKSTATY